MEGKSSGEDNIPPEILKRCDLDDIVLGFCNEALVNREKPSQWSILNIVPLPKSGDLSLGGNYRGISLSSIVARTHNRMILNRIRPELDEYLKNQSKWLQGRKNYSGTHTCTQKTDRRGESKQYTCNNNIHRLQKSIWHHPSWQNVNNSSSLWYPRPDFWCYWRYVWENHSQRYFPWWRDRSFWNISGSVTEGYACSIPVCHSTWLCPENDHWSKRRSTWFPPS